MVGVLGVKFGFKEGPLLNGKFDFGLFEVGLNDPLLLENFLICFSINTEFLP